MDSLSPSDPSPLRESRELADKLPALLIQAERVARTIAQGVHGRRRIGVGESFWEYRYFRKEDPTSRIDWRQSGKSDRLFVRENEWEAAQTLWLWLDSSASMDYRSPNVTSSKHHRGALLVIALASLVLRASERVQLLAQQDFPIANHDRHLEQFAENLLLAPKHTGTPKREVTPHSDMVLFSDFFDDFDDVEEVVLYYANQAVRGTLVQILDPSEETFPFDGRVLFRNPESDEVLLAERAQTMRDEYQERLSNLQQSLKSLCQQVGWSFMVHRTDKSPQTTLLSLHQAMSDRSDFATQRWARA